MYFVRIFAWSLRRPRMDSGPLGPRRAMYFKLASTLRFQSKRPAVFRVSVPTIRLYDALGSLNQPCIVSLDAHSIETYRRFKLRLSQFASIPIIPNTWLVFAPFD